MKYLFAIPCLALLYFGLSGIAQAEETSAAPLKIRLLFADQEAVVRLDNHPAVQDFLSMLPLTVSFEDYNNIEKIGYLPRKLRDKDSPSSCDPSVGTFAYYAPWGNLSVFYRDFRHSDGLVPLGHVESGIDHLAHMQGTFSVRLERMP